MVCEDVAEGLEDPARLFLGQQPAFGQQHGARLVDLHLIAPVMALHAFEQRSEDGILVDPRGEFPVFAHWYSPALCAMRHQARRAARALRVGMRPPANPRTAARETRHPGLASATLMLSAPPR